MNKTMSDFTISWGSGFSDPVWGYDNYHVLEHRSDYVYIYMRPSDKAIEFIVDSSRGDGIDRVMYYPSGLTVDNTVNGFGTMISDTHLAVTTTPPSHSARKSLAANLLSPTLTSQRTSMLSPAQKL